MKFAARLSQLLEGMGATEYTPPEKPYQLMADFYLVQFMQAPVGKRGQVLSQRAEELLRDLQYVERTLVPYLRQHMLAMAGYAILRELRHVFDAAIKESRAYSAALCEAADDDGEESESYVPGPQEYAGDDEDDDYDYDGDDYVDWGLKSDDGVELLKELGISEQLADVLESSVWDVDLLKRDQFTLEDYLQGARAGVYCFNPGNLHWRSQYGGQLWQRACQVWFQLYGAHDLAEAVHAIDLLYSLQHNSGALLNKNEEYNGPWLKQLLDLKFRAKEPEELLPYASSYMQQLVPQLLYALYGRALRPDYRGKSERFDYSGYKQVMEQIRELLPQHGYEAGDYQPAGSLGMRLLPVRYNGEKIAAVWPTPYHSSITVGNRIQGYKYGEIYQVDIDQPDLYQQVVNYLNAIREQAQ